MWLLTLACTPPDADSGQTEATPAETAAPSHDTDTGTGTAKAVLELVEGLHTVVRVRWQQPESATTSIRFTLPDGSTGESPARATEAGTVERLVIGPTFEQRVEVEVVQAGVDDPVAAGVITTGLAPEYLPMGTLLADAAELQDPTMPYLLTSMNKDGWDRYGIWYVFVIDRAGNVIWAQEQPDDWISRHVTVTYEGDAMLVDRQTMWVDFDNGAGSTVARMTLDGEVEHVYTTPGLHHALVSLPGHEMAWMAKTGDYFEHLDHVTEDGVQTTLWDCEQLHDAAGAGGSCGTNGLYWHEPTGHYLMSAHSTETVAEVDPEAGVALRWWGYMDGSWTFEPSESQFWWQHGPTFTDAGTLMVSSKDERWGDETVVREYSLDEENQSLEEVWSFGEGRGVYGAYMGEAHRLPSGNTLHVYGAGGHMVEATPDGEVAWEMTWEGDKHNGHTTPLTLEQLYGLLGDG